MRTLKKIKKYENKIDLILNLLDNFIYDRSKCSPRQFLCLYNDSGDNEKVLTLNQMVVNYFTSEVINEIYNLVEDIKNDFATKKIWLAVYTPKEGLDFHFDHTNRYIMNFNTNDDFYYLEANVSKNDKTFNNISDIQYVQSIQDQYKNLSFAEFLNEFNKNPENNILKLEESTVYTYDEVVGHTFYNNSENKVRVSLIFDI